MLVILLIAIPGMACYIEKNQKYQDKKVTTYSCTNRADVGYNVFLIPNQLYPERSLGEGKAYVASLVDYIDTTFKYEFNGERPATITGKYNITATLEGFTKGFSGNKTLWQKEYQLQPDTDFSGDDSHILVEKKQPINLNNYANYIKMASDTIKMNFDTNLKIKWNVSVEVNTPEGVIKEKLTPVMLIPLGQQLVDITGNLSDQKKGALDETKQELSPTYRLKFLACCIAEGVVVVSLLFLLIFTSPLVIRPLQRKQKQIFKNYGCRMVGVEGELEPDSSKIIEVASIEELVKIADDISKPILYKNSTEFEQITKYYVMDDNITYVLDINKDVLNSLFEAGPSVALSTEQDGEDIFI